MSVASTSRRPAARVREELDVAVGAAQRRGHERAHAEAERVERADDLAQHRAVHDRVADDAALADVLAAGLELRLHQQHELGIGGGEREQVGRDGPQRDEREVGDAQVGRRIDRARLELAHVRALHHRDARVVAQRPRELTAADVDRDDVRGAVPQQAVGEAARRRADVDRAGAGDVDRERGERARELRAAARHEHVVARLDGNDDRLGRVDLPRGGGGRGAAHRHPAGDDRLDGSRPARREAAPHELDVEASPHRSAGSRGRRLPRAPSGPRPSRRLARRSLRRGLLRGGPSCAADLLLTAFFLAGIFAAGAFAAAFFFAGILRGRPLGRRLLLGRRRARARSGGTGARRAAGARARRGRAWSRGPSAPSWRCTSVLTIARSSSLRRRLISIELVDRGADLIARELALGDQVGGEPVGLRSAQLGEVHAGLEHTLPIRRLGHRYLFRSRRWTAWPPGGSDTTATDLESNTRTQPRGHPARTLTGPVSAAPASSSGTSRARSAATNGGGGSGTGSPPDAPAPRPTARARTAIRARPRTRRRSSADRPPPRPRSPNRERTSSAIGDSGLPATSGSRPAAVATAAASAPAPGTTPPSIGYVGSRLVATNRAPPRAASAARVRPSKSKSRWKPTTTASTGPLDTTRKPRRIERLDHARARAREHRRTRRGAGSRRARPRPARSCTRRRDRPGCRTRASRCT